MYNLYTVCQCNADSILLAFIYFGFKGVLFHFLNFSQCVVCMFGRGGQYDQNLISRYDKFYITITIYISLSDIVIFFF